MLRAVRRWMTISQSELRRQWRDMTVATEMEKTRMGSTHCLDESPVLEESRLILDIIARDPCLDLISESL